MTNDWLAICAVVIALSATGFFILTIKWVIKLKETVSSALSEVANQQIRTVHRLDETIVHLQKQQRNCEQQIQTLAQAGLRLQQELVNVSTRLEHSQSEAVRGDQTIH